MADLETFRKETRAWLEANAPESLRGLQLTELDGVWGGKKAEFAHPDQKQWLELMGEKGWTAPSWPAEYGGGGLSKEESKVLSQEMAALKIPPPLRYSGPLGDNSTIFNRSAIGLRLVGQGLFNGAFVRQAANLGRQSRLLKLFGNFTQFG